MTRPEFSLAYLTVFGTPPGRMIEIAANIGYDYVSLRLIRVTDDEMEFAYLTDGVVVKEVKARLADTGLRVLDVELVRVGPEDAPADFSRFIDVAGELGARHIVTQLPDFDRGRAIDHFVEICQMASPYDMTVDLEFIPWSETNDLAAAAEIVTRAAQHNGGILVDTLHFARSGSEVSQLRLLRPELFHLIQLCDAPRESPQSHEGLVHAARNARSLPGEAGLNLRPLVEALPEVPYSLEVPNDTMRQDLGVEEFARRVLRSGRRFLAHENIRPAVSVQRG